MRNRQEEIKAKGFDIVHGRITDADYQEGHTGYQSNIAGIPVVDFGKLKIGAKTLDDAVLDLGFLRKVNPRLSDKQTILRAIENYDLKTMREVSDFFYKASGIYSRILRYLAFMYRYDWYVTPYVGDEKLKNKPEQILKPFSEALRILDNFHVKKKLGDIALKVLRFGVYYGYRVKTARGYSIQELPYNYCRSRFFDAERDKPAVEFNMKYFDDTFKDSAQKMRILKMFPKEFEKGYSLYKAGKLPPDFPGDENGWYLLDPKMAVKFNANGEDYPAFISVIPLIIDLDEAQDLDRQKTMQRLLKIIIQKMPLDKNGDLIFDVDEAQQLHNNAVKMLGRAIGVDVLTTFADVEVADLADTSVASAQSDDLERVERQLYNEAGVSQMQFNTDGNIALEKSILNDAASLYDLLLQFEIFLNDIISEFNTHPKKLEFRVQILTTTIYNYQELAKMYKEQTQLGYSKMLPQIALGQSQSSILANAFFENDILDLINVFIPPLMSSTMNGDILSRSKGNSDTGAGRKEKPDDEKSEKTIKNLEAQG